MLKLIYTEIDVHLEQFAANLEKWVQDRVIFSLRTGDQITVEKSSAAFLLPVDSPELDILIDLVNQEKSDVVEIGVGDQEFMEVSLLGYWLTDDPDSSEGVFVSELSSELESYLFQFWNEARSNQELSSINN